MLAFYEAGIEISQRVPNFGALNLTTLTAKTYTTQHDGEFLDYTDFKVYFFGPHPSTFIETGLGCCKTPCRRKRRHIWTKETHRWQKPKMQINLSHKTFEFNSHLALLLPKLPNTHQLIIETRADNRPLPSLLPTLDRLHIASVVHALVLFELGQHAESPFA